MYYFSCISENVTSNYSISIGNPDTYGIVTIRSPNSNDTELKIPFLLNVHEIDPLVELQILLDSDVLDICEIEVTGKILP